MLTTAATYHDIIVRAMRFAGILQGGEQPAPEDEDDIGTIGNGMLDAWRMDRLFVYNFDISTYALPANQQSVNIGPGAAAPFNVARPDKIENANIVITSQAPNVRIPLYPMDDQEWMDISVRPLPTPSIPTSLYYSPSYPLGVLNFWPTPQSGLSVELETWATLSQFTNLTDAFSFPPGYFEAIYQNIGLRLCTPEWGIDSVPQSIQELAQQSRMRINSLNMSPPPQMQVDAGMQGNRQQEGHGRLFWAGNTATHWNR